MGPWEGCTCANSQHSARTCRTLEPGLWRKPWTPRPQPVDPSHMHAPAAGLGQDFGARWRLQVQHLNPRSGVKVGHEGWQVNAIRACQRRPACGSIGRGVGGGSGRRGRGPRTQHLAARSPADFQRRDGRGRQGAQVGSLEAGAGAGAGRVRQPVLCALVAAGPCNRGGPGGEPGLLCGASGPGRGMRAWGRVG